MFCVAFRVNHWAWLILWHSPREIIWIIDIYINNLIWNLRLRCNNFSRQLSLKIFAFGLILSDFRKWRQVAFWILLWITVYTKTIIPTNWLIIVAWFEILFLNIHNLQSRLSDLDTIWGSWIFRRFYVNPWNW